jgi:Bacterial protein of unknown function (DUF922)
MRWGHHISPVTAAPLRSAALCLVALLALGSPSWAQKTDPKGADAKPGDTKAAPTDPDIKWQPGSKLDWSQFKGGMPKKEGLHAETVATMWPTYKCNADGTYTLDVQAQFSQKHSTVDPANTGPDLLAHEQIHFDIAQKHAIALKKKLDEIFKAKCKCKMSAKDIDEFNSAVKAAETAEYTALAAEQKQYDKETDHGQKKEAQQQWANNISKDLGQPAPAPPPAPKDTGSDTTPKVEKPAACKDCEAAEADRKKKVAAIEGEMDTLNKQYGPLSAQSMALNREIDAAKADDANAQRELTNAKNDGAKKAANKKIEAAATKAKNAEGKLTPIKTKMDGIDKKIKELREKLDLLEKPAKCPKCPADAGNSSFEPLPGDEFAGGPITGGGNFCPPTQETYIPGTPGHFSEQYASEIPGSGTPGEFVSYKVPFTSDSTAYCTFGEGTSVPGTTVATDDNGSWIPPSSDSGSGQTDIPAGPGTKIATGNPVTPPEGPPGRPPADGVTSRLVDPPPQPAATPVPQATETPKTTDNPPPTDTPKTPDQPPLTKTTDNPPPDIPTTTDTPRVTIFIKASETVLDGSQTGEPIQGQVIKLVLKEKPALPTTTESRTAMDKGFDKPAPQCTTATDGQCKVDIPAEDRPLYALKDPPRTGGKPLNNYRLAINVMKHSGGVAETTGKPVPYLNSATSNGDVTAELFRIGNRTFVRLGFNTPSGATDNPVDRYSGLLGVPVEVDICLIKEPGPPLGSEPVSYGAINQELPASVIRLRPASARVLKR